MPLGTLDMAWASPREVGQRPWTPLPERHLPFAHMVERLLQDVMRQFRESAGYVTEASLGHEDESVSIEELWGPTWCAGARTIARPRTVFSRA